MRAPPQRHGSQLRARKRSPLGELREPPCESVQARRKRPHDPRCRRTRLVWTGCGVPRQRRPAVAPSVPTVKRPPAKGVLGKCPARLPRQRTRLGPSPTCGPSGGRGSASSASVGEAFFMPNGLLTDEVAYHQLTASCPNLRFSAPPPTQQPRLTSSTRLFYFIFIPRILHIVAYRGIS